jgi:hypothetical protein
MRKKTTEKMYGLKQKSLQLIDVLMNNYVVRFIKRNKKRKKIYLIRNTLYA